jgi:hypothetical protein
MYYRGPGFLTVVWFGSFPLPSLPTLRKASCFSFSVFLCIAVELADGRGEEEGAKSYRQRESLVLYKRLTIYSLLQTHGFFVPYLLRASFERKVKSFFVSQWTLGSILFTKCHDNTFHFFYMWLVNTAIWRNDWQVNERKLWKINI